MKYTKPDSQGTVYNFNYNWKFKLADIFPLKDALEAHRDAQGRYFYEPGYDDSAWQPVGVPHTFNDGDMFVNRIEDAGTGQKRTFAFYRKQFDVPYGKKVIIEFEGVRQTCYLYVNGRLAGFSENGVAPFAFDITPYINQNGENTIAVATDNTSTRNMAAVAMETPNHEDATPGANQGAGFFWNCNDFNPSVGGLTKNIRLHVKPSVYLALNVYSNLRTKGIYIYSDNSQVTVEAEVVNETATDVTVGLISYIVDAENVVIAAAESGKTRVHPRVSAPDMLPPLTITPADAYACADGIFTPFDDESAVAPTVTESVGVTVVTASAAMQNMNLWSVNNPYLYDVYTHLIVNGEVMDVIKTTTGFRKMEYRGGENGGLYINGERVWLTGYAQRSSNEWAAVGCAVDWLKDADARLVRESNANHIRWMHVAACPADIRSCDRYGIICTQPAGDKERENHGRQWDMRVELMRDVIIYFRNNPSILFWETGNNSVSPEHMREMTELRKTLDPHGGRFMGCRTINKRETVDESEYVGTMLNRHAGRFQSELMPVLETEYLREESPRRVWDDCSPPDYDYDNVWVGRGGKKQTGFDVHDLTAEEFAIVAAQGYSEFFNDRMGGASKKNLYSAAAALCWTDSAHHGRQAASENARMSGRVDAVRVRKQNFDVFRVMQSGKPEIKILGHWNYPPFYRRTGQNGKPAYRYPIKRFENGCYVKTGEYAYRDPENKTVYVVGSYSVSKVELFVNGISAGCCEKPLHTFIFKFDNIDVTAQGCVTAIGYAYDGTETADKIETAGPPAKIKLTPHTGASGLLADGVDIAYVDVEIVDNAGRVCPLCFDKIMFTLHGDAVFLGGYNSGRYNGFGKNDSPIHQNFVYAECGVNRVFIRSGVQASEITLTAHMNGLEASVTLRSAEMPIGSLTDTSPHILESSGSKTVFRNDYTFRPIPQADADKYVPDATVPVSIVINNGHEVSRAVFMDNAVWGGIITVMERLKGTLKHAPLDYEYDADNRRLTVNSNGKVIIAQYGHTHLLVDGEENLMGGEPTLRRDVFWMEINPVISQIDGVTAQYDEGVSIYRIDTV